MFINQCLCNGHENSELQIVQILKDAYFNWMYDFTQRMKWAQKSDKLTSHENAMPWLGMRSLGQ